MKKSLGAKTILYPTPVLIVGTYDQKGKPNVMNAAWGGICCSVPPCISVSLRKATYTYENIMARKAYTINIPSEDYAKEADYFGLVSGRDVDKFARSGLTPVKSDLVDAPYIAEFPLILECKVIHIFEIGLHTQFIGEVMDVKADPAILGENEVPVMEKLKPMLHAPEIRHYYGVGKDIGAAFSIGKEIKNR
ncbi:flavin reductase family protein [Desulfallas sp. Bu1-1]|uniref:flavin reductase family protein n=1 Tax=Desulfallas sp. Bu1-1 TaxID=2787620 RepID=UPI00189D4A97|nr:flavin reductase family protein [Desulfallas sp. Bu1-1]MBF7081812.1 flavin reductase family protein [Desulfallas sp. Bu1-1]